MQSLHAPNRIALAPFALSLALSLGCGNEKPIDTWTGPDGGDATGTTSDAESVGAAATPDATASEPAPDAAGAPDTAVVSLDGGPSSADGAITDGATLPSDGPPATAACQLPEGLPLAGRFLTNVPNTMAFAFDQGGHLVGVDMKTRDLLATPYQGPPVTLLPAAVRGFGQSINVMPDGDLILVDEEDLVTITPQGMKSVIATLPSSGRMTLDPQGRPVIGVGDTIERLDGNKFTVISRDPRGVSALAFSADGATLYIASAAGEIRQATIGPDGKAGPQQRLATIPNDATTVIVAGIALDECGNLFVVNEAHQVWRVTPAGGVIKVVQTKADLGGLRFGSGLGGWKATALYLAQPISPPMTGGAIEVELGVRGAHPAAGP